MLDEIIITTALADSATAGQASTQSAIASQFFTPFILTKILIIPLLLWVIRGIVLNALKRFHLIRNLYVDIIQQIDSVKENHPLILDWAKTNLDAKPPILKSKMAKFSWTPDIGQLVYKTALPLILETLWGKEIGNVHTIYRDFWTYDLRMENVAKRFVEAEDDFAIVNSEDFKLFQADLFAAHSISSRFFNLDDSKIGARNVFYRPSFYWFHVIGMIAITFAIFLVVKSF